MIEAVSVLFEVRHPAGRAVPVVVEVPHSGLEFDPESLALCTAPGRSIGRDADLYVHELFANAPELGASLLYSRASRYVCDLNRADDDLEGSMGAEGGETSSPHGVIWRRTTSGRPALSSPLSQEEVNRRLDLLYRPYHATLQRLLDEKKQEFGFVVLLCGHSMPSYGRLGDRRADLVPGSRGRTSAAASVLDVPDRVAKKFGMDVAHDTPYRGGFATRHYGRPEQQVHALQVELARRLYMDETTLARLPHGFERTRQFCAELVQALGELRL